MAFSPRAPARRASTRRQRASLWRLIRANLFDIASLLRQSAVALVGFAIVVLGSAIYLHMRAQRPITDITTALYQALKLLILQSDEPFPPSSDALGQALFFLVPFLGLGLIVQSVLNFGRYLFNKGDRRQAWQVALASTYSGHVIVCGLGRVGLRVVTRLLDANYHTVVIEKDWAGEFVQIALSLGVPVIVGDARDPLILRQAGLSRSRGIVAGINGDLLNVEIGLAARGVRPDAQVILRAFNEDFDRSLEHTFGLHHAFSVSALGAPTFVAASISRDLDYVLPLGRELLAVTQFTVPRELGERGMTLRELEDRFWVRAIRWDARPGASISRMAELARNKLSPGDTVAVLGPLHHLYELRMAIGAGHPTTASADRGNISLQRPNEQYDTVIVCGLGKVGFRVVHWLIQAEPRPRVVVIHKEDADSPFLRRLAELDGVISVVGDATDPDVLRRAGLQRAYSIAALTSNDLTNLQIGLAARRERGDVHVVLRVFSDALAEKLADLFGIHTAYSTSDLAAPTLAAAAVLGGVEMAFFSERALFAIDQVLVKEHDRLSGQTLAEVAARHDALVIGLKRGDTMQILPLYTVTIAPGDELTVLANLTVLARMRASA